MHLSDLQHQFLDYLLSADSDIEAKIDPAYQYRLSIYRNNIRVGLKAYLGDIFPAVKALVGDDFFNGLAQSHFQNQPPDNGNLHSYGGSFADYMAIHPALSDMTYLVDVARLEWAYHQAYYANAGQAVPVKSGIEQLLNQKVMLSPASFLIHSPYPIDEVWRQSRPEYQGEFNVRLNNGPADLLVHRHRGQVEISRLQKAEFRFLTELQSGHYLGPAIEAAMTEPGADRLTAFLSRCITQQLFCTIE